jgi:hypothetical protein
VSRVRNGEGGQGYVKRLLCFPLSLSLMINMEGCMVDGDDCEEDEEQERGLQNYFSNIIRFVVHFKAYVTILIIY